MVSNAGAVAPGGSSPLARGTFSFSLVIGGLLRLIPARAGNIVQALPEPKTQPAHPRSRGEHDGLPVRGFLWCGSSPLARGTYDEHARSAPGTRLIPARAGNIATAYKWSSSKAAHPRSRGEHRFHNERFEGKAGSSPLARGTFGRGSGADRRERLIPARAGNISAEPD